MAEDPDRDDRLAALAIAAKFFIDETAPGALRGLYAIRPELTFEGGSISDTVHFYIVGRSNANVFMDAIQKTLGINRLNGMAVYGKESKELQSFNSRNGTQYDGMCDFIFTGEEVRRLAEFADKYMDEEEAERWFVRIRRNLNARWDLEPPSDEALKQSVSTVSLNYNVDSTPFSFDEFAQVVLRRGGGFSWTDPAKLCPNIVRITDTRFADVAQRKVFLAEGRRTNFLDVLRMQASDGRTADANAAISFINSSEIPALPQQMDPYKVLTFASDEAFRAYVQSLLKPERSFTR